MSFTRWSVRISDTYGTICGAGVYLGRDLVLTCAHVIGDDPGRPVNVEFLGTAAPEPITAVVTEGGWWPVGDRQEGDAAVLRLSSPAPPDATPAPLNASWSRGDTVWAYGYPGQLHTGVHASATVTGETMGTGWIQLNDRNAGGVEIQPGFSGGAVYDSEAGKVFGIVVLAYRAERMSWLLPLLGLLAGVG